MKLVCGSLCFLVIFFASILEAQITQPDIQSDSRPELVRVRLLTTSAPQFQISGWGLKFQNLSQPFRPVAIPDNGQAQIRILNKDGKKIWAVRVNGQVREHLFTEQYLLVQGSGLRVGAKALPEKILLNGNGKNKMDVVGVMKLDDYVVGVLASEMPLSWPLETLKAQAVAARSYALAVMEERQDQPYHLESSILDQVFRHVLAEDAEDPLIKKAVQAVKETQGIKLYDEDKKVLKAFFHSDCGGKTTTADNVWNTTVNAGVAVDSSCPTSPRAHWQLSLSKEELSRLLKVPAISGLDLIKVPSEKRIKAVRVAFNAGQNKVLSVNDFRQMLGFQDLRSSLFELKKVGEKFLFQGQGYGHGVGLCQWGSRSLGRNGQNYRQILRHYYPLASLQRSLK